MWLQSGSLKGMKLRDKEVLTRVSVKCTSNKRRDVLLLQKWLKHDNVHARRDEAVSGRNREYLNDTREVNFSLASHVFPNPAMKQEHLKFVGGSACVNVRHWMLSISVSACAGFPVGYRTQGQLDFLQRGNLIVMVTISHKSRESVQESETQGSGHNFFPLLP